MSKNQNCKNGRSKIAKKKSLTLIIKYCQLLSINRPIFSLTKNKQPNFNFSLSKTINDNVRKLVSMSLCY